MKSNEKFSDGSSSAYVELPVQSAYLSWRRGNAALRAVAKADPALYFGGWRAFTKTKDNQALPAIPVPVVVRVSQDGKHEYEVYATNILHFLPIQHRTRFEFRKKEKDVETGREYNKVVASSKNKLPGYQPHRQIFGLVFSPDTDEYAPGVIRVDSWSAFIAIEKAGQQWNKVAIPDGKVLVRRYGSIGLKDGRPKFETYGQGQSTPIDAIGLENPRYFDLLDEFNQLWDASLAWKECERWNATGEIVEEPRSNAREVFMGLCDAMGLADYEIEQLLAEFKNDYSLAVSALQEGTAGTVEAKPVSLAAEKHGFTPPPPENFDDDFPIPDY